MLKELKNYVFILLISILISIYFFEGYLNYQDFQLKSISIKKKLLLEKEKKIFDERSQLEYFNDLKKELNQDIKVSFYPSYFLNKDNKIQPLSGISNSLTIDCNENGYFNVYNSDRYGFNNPDSEWDKDKIEYLIIGDSFAHGSCVNRPDDIASVLRAVSGKNVLNLGYSANGPLLEYASLREYLLPNVKNVIWLYYEENDYKDLNLELQDSLLKKYLNDEGFSQNLRKKQFQIDLMINNEMQNLLNYRESLIKKKNLKYKILKFIRLDKTKKILRNTKQDFQKRKFLEIIKKTKSLTKKNNSKLFFVYLPSYSRYNKILNKEDIFHYNIIKDSIKKLDIKFIDIHQSVISKDPKSYFPFGLTGHYNKKGYFEVANFIYENTQ